MVSAKEKGTFANIKVGVLLDSTLMPAWQAASLKSIVESNLASIAALILPTREITGVRHSGSRPASARGVLRLFRRLDSQKRPITPDALAKVSVDELLPAVVRLTLPPPNSGSISDLVSSLNRLSLDVLVSFAENRAPSELFSGRRTFWYFEDTSGALSPADGSEVGFADVIRRRSWMVGRLCIMHAQLESVRIAYESYSSVDATSHRKTRNPHLWKCSAFLLRALRNYHAMGADKFLQSLPTRQPSIDTLPKPLASLCREVGLAVSLVPYVSWRLKLRKRRRTTRERWILLTGPADHQRIPVNFSPMHPPRARFWADPHAVEKDGVISVFFEDASVASGKGHIAVMTSQDGATYSRPVPVIERPYHLSYPFVFNWEGEYFMIPESADNRTIELYRCIRYPDQWVYEHNVMENISAYDATLIQHQGRWWLFANVAERDGASSWDELSLFHAESPISREWQPHPNNPVLSDVRRARPAGPFFYEDGRLYRPSQDSSGLYGRALNFNEVIELNEHRYRERLVKTIQPDWDTRLVAVHSYCRVGAIGYMDALFREPR